MKLIIKDLVKNFKAKKVICGASYEFENGKIYGLLGRNGAGKTTLFNCINGDLDYDGGQCLIECDGVTRQMTTDDIGYVLSVPEVPAFLTGREFLKFFIDINKDKIPDLKSIDEYFDMVGIKEEDRDRLLKDYSHGMKNKIQMIVNVIANTKVLLLDEPLTSLDVVAAEDMKKLLKDNKKDRVLILSTHIMELALTLCDEIVLLTKGQLVPVDEYGDSGEKLSEEGLKDVILSKLREEDNNV